MRGSAEMANTSKGAGKKNRQQGSPPELPTGPWDFLKWAVDVIPEQTKFVLGGVVVFAAAALILGWIRDYSLWTVLGIAFAIIVLGLIVGALSAVSARSKRGLGSFLGWALSILLVVVLCLIISSAFFGVPASGAVIISRLLRSADPLTNQSSGSHPVIINSGDRVGLESLERALREEPSERDPYQRVLDLSKRPELELKGTLELPRGARGYLVASTLRIDGGAIVTNGSDLTIEVNNLIADSGTLKSFLNPETPLPGAPGASGGRIRLIVHGNISGRLVVDLRGQRGADGQAGQNGAKGPKGAPGDNASSGTFDCSRGAGRGRDGGMGVAGGNGADGLAGGNGGVLVVSARDLRVAKDVIGSPDVRGGAGGTGGAAGIGGPGGDGGDGGGPRGWCQGSGPSGSTGPKGPDGRAGGPGPRGAEGQVRFESLAAV
jgi:hypothetical protein